MKTDPENSHDDDPWFAVRVTLIVIVVLAILLELVL